jgi:hypothetical protein
MEKLAKAAFQTMDMFSVTGGGSAYSYNDVDKLKAYTLSEYKKVVEACRFFYKNDPVAGTVINKIIDIAINDIIFEQNNLSDNEFRIFAGIKESLLDYAEICALEYLISGLVVPEIKYTVADKSVLKEYGIKKYDSMILPEVMWVRDPSTIKINYNMVMDKPSYYVTLPEELVFFIKTGGQYPDGTEDKELFRKLKELYPEFVAKVAEGGLTEILLENDLIIRYRNLSDSPYPVPYLHNALDPLRHKRNIRRMDYSIASRAIGAIQLFRLGDKDFPVTEDDQGAFDDLKGQMVWRDGTGRNVERIFQLFANHTLQIDWIYPPLDALLNDRKYAEVNADIFFALGFPRILTTGEVEKTGTSDPEFAALSPMRTMENVRKSILKIIKGIVREIVTQNRFKDVPKVRFDNMNLHSFKNFVEGMVSLYETGNISRSSFAQAFGFDWEEEMSVKETEQEILKEKGLPEFSPQPFSPQPTSPGKNTGTDTKSAPKPSGEGENK